MRLNRASIRPHLTFYCGSTPLTFVSPCILCSWRINFSRVLAHLFVSRIQPEPSRRKTLSVWRWCRAGRRRALTINNSAPCFVRRDIWSGGAGGSRSMKQRSRHDDVDTQWRHRLRHHRRRYAHDWRAHQVSANIVIISIFNCFFWTPYMSFSSSPFSHPYFVVTV